ncbi:MAG TPA: hypothetical protein VFI65_03580 [Streptosporangiaceae bacterium]|nr:hypothetical protein [Streptosporangiaceae bacterium]
MPSQEHSDRHADPDSSQKSSPSADDAAKVTEVSDKDEFVEFDLGSIELIETKVFG